MTKPKPIDLIIEKLLDARGYVVLGQPPERGHTYGKGEIVREFSGAWLDYDLIVQRRTTIKDWDDQYAFLREMMPEFDKPNPRTKGGMFWRAVVAS